MKPSFTSLVVLGCLLVSVVAADNERPPDTKTLSGTWRVLTLEFAGERREAPEGDEAVVTFREGKALVKDEEQFSLKVDSTTDPKIIDFTKLNDPEKGQMLEGIYKFDGEQLVICLWSGTGTKSRPTEFATKAGDNYVLIVLKPM
jgi:uncharacterized protein (TIGR03067 family)